MPPCVQAARAASDEKMNKTGFDPSGHGRNNAVEHCATACEIMRKCGKAGFAAWQSREDPNELACRIWPGSCAYDRRNNDVGSGLAKYNGGCFKLCQAAASKLRW
jgi:hypothetical protein